MAQMVIRRFVSSADKDKVAIDGTGKVLMVDPNSYVSMLGSFTHNVTVNDPLFPGGSFDLSGAPLNYTSNYPNNPPIAGVRGWTSGGYQNYYVKSASIWNTPHTYTWRVYFTKLQLNFDATNGLIYWQCNVSGLRTNYPNGADQGSASWKVRKVCSGTDFSVAGDYVLVGSVTHYPTGQTIWGSSNNWGLTISV